MEWVEKKANMENMEELIRFILDRMSRDFQAGKKQLMEMRLIGEELFTNTIKYAYKGGSGLVTLGYDWDKEKRKLRLIIKDAGEYFDPTDIEEPDLTLDVMDRPIGGLGIYMVKQLSDSIIYERKEDMNQLTVIKTYGMEEKL